MTCKHGHSKNCIEIGGDWIPLSSKCVCLGCHEIIETLENASLAESNLPPDQLVEFPEND